MIIKIGLGVGALMEAYHRHAATRTTRSLLFCATALLDALDQDEPLKPLGLHAKLEGFHERTGLMEGLGRRAAGGRQTS